ncbi:MAG: hypothetical protein LBT11_05925 [Treponema sp.]|jgi:tetratricopeptide (TPR) repeat protein|nr:hypothetical protein [Treponema sp.]
MIGLFFSLRYQAQIRSTRPELFKGIERSVVQAIEDAGGTPQLDRRAITASFDDASIGFWIDMVILLDTIQNIMTEAAPELYGFSCVLLEKLGDEVYRLSWTLPGAQPEGGSGLWCESRLKKALRPYVSLGTGPLGYTAIKAISFLPEKPPADLAANGEKVAWLLKQGDYRNTVLTGPRFCGKRAGLRRYAAELLGSIPLLRINFGAGGTGLSCFTDALSPEIRALALRISEYSHTPVKDLSHELESLVVSVSRERFRDEYSAYTLQQAGRFLELLLGIFARAGTERGRPVLVLENIDRAGRAAAELFSSVYRKLPNRASLLVFATAEREPQEDWNGVFTRNIKIGAEGFTQPQVSNLSRDFWEMAYAFALLGRYFPPAQFESLFAETGRNPRLVSQTMEYFLRRGIIDCREAPEPRIPGFIGRAEQVLGERRELVRTMVWTRILAWVEAGKFRPCFNLLKALADLGGQGSDTLILDSISADIMNGAYRGIEEALQSSRFTTVVGEVRALPLRYIFNSGKALICGGEEDIRRVFLEGPPDADAFPVYKTQMLVDLARYQLSVQDIDAASEAVKESILLAQKQRGGKDLAQAYRLFSLVNVCRQRLGDAIDYFNFAQENAERSGNSGELAITGYYAAGTYFLFGNISGAERAIHRAIDAASGVGRYEWADRARFLQGRLRFETGRYKEALNIFESLQGSADSLGSRPAASDERRTVLAAWIYRTEVYLKRPQPRKPEILNLDARLFELEAAWLREDYPETFRLADILAQNLPEGDFLLIEQPDWRSGFSQCELLLSSYKKLLYRLLSIYRALALSRLNGKDRAKGDQALESIRPVIREEGLPRMDPLDAFYYYAYYCVLRDSGSPEVDMNTAVSMAFKRLQSRASRIDEVETKRAYLSLNYWNSALWETAKQYKLI